MFCALSRFTFTANVEPTGCVICGGSKVNSADGVAVGVGCVPGSRLAAGCAGLFGIGGRHICGSPSSTLLAVQTCKARGFNSLTSCARTTCGMRTNTFYFILCSVFCEENRYFRIGICARNG